MFEGGFEDVQSDLVIDVGNSGTSLRLLTAVVSTGTHTVVLTGDESLVRRPNQPLIDALRHLGAQVESDHGRAPICITGPIHTQDVELPAGQSSQFASALFLALARSGEASRLTLLKPVHSLPYFQLTLDMAARFGSHFRVRTDDEAVTVYIEGNGFTSPGQWIVEGDWSSAAFLLVAAWGAGRKIELDGLTTTSRQADQAIQAILEQLGGHFEWSSDSRVLFTPGKSGQLNHIDVQGCPDLFPILCVLAACLPYSLRIDGAPNLRHKESDRIRLMSEGLTTLGIPCTPLSDGLIVGTGPLKPGAVSTEHDHRIQMSFRVLSCLTDTIIELDGYGSETVSYPAFEQDLERLFEM